MADAGGRITARPTEVDDIVKKAWDPVYCGQDRPHTHIVAEFLAKYKDYLFYGNEYVVERITGDRLLREFRHSSATAASWDQWEHQEWAFMPILAANWLAKLLNLVEQGAPWPRRRWGKRFLPVQNKTEEPSTDPVVYKILLILPRLYRRSASMGLHDLHEWIRRWQLPEMYAGVPGGGAELAWW